MQKKKPYGETLKEQLRAGARDRLYNFMLADGAIRGVILNGTRMVNEMRANHELGILETLVLGRAYLGAGLMSADLKSNDQISIKFDCSGPIKGLVAGVGFANLGNDVICLDIDSDKIARLESGEVTIYEPGLDELFKRNLSGGRLKFTTDVQTAVEESDIIFVCVGTPTNERQEADLTAVREVAASVGKYMNGYKVIVNKSTVPVGTADLVRKIIGENQTSQLPFDVVSNPEFLREGAAVKDFENPNRIIVGTDSKKAEEVLTSLYRSVARTDRPIMVTGVKSAEIIKYASNAMLATRISFMNQLSHLCEETGADIKDVSRGMGLDGRIGPRFLQAGVGYGGSCFPKDVKALIATLKQHGCDSDLFEAVNRVNERHRTFLPSPVVMFCR